MGEQDDRRLPASDTRARGPDAGPGSDQLRCARPLVAFGATG